MHSFWIFFLKKRQFSWLLMSALIAVGIYSAYIIPKESAPEVVIPIGVISTSYPGASAADIEELITNKIEAKAGNVDNIKTMSSVSRDGFSSITVEFDASADIDKSIQDLKDAVDTAKSELPQDANDPFVTKISFSNDPIFIVAISADLPGIEFTRLGEKIQDELEGVSGVSDVEITGTRARETQVTVRQEALLTYNITLSDVAAALQAANLSIPIGNVNTENIEYAIRFEGDIADAEEIRDIPIRTQGGQTIFIRDVATITNGVERAETISRVSVDGAPAESAMSVAIYKRTGSDVTTISKLVKEKLEELQAPSGLLSDSQVLIVFDQGENVTKDLSELTTTGVETVLLVVLCLLLTIGWRESLVAALSIPLSFVIAFIGLYLSGNTINFVSLFALILAVGILVDSGIVVTEAIHTRMRKFATPYEAAKEAIREYSWPLIGGTMTTVAVFVPLFFLSGITGEFIASIPYTIIFVLLASIFVALGMVPLIAIYITKNASSNRFEVLQEEYAHKAQMWYRARLYSFLQNKKSQRIFLWVLAISFFAVLTLPVSGLMKVVFFPGENVDNIYIEVEARQGTPVEETDLSLRAAEEILYELPYVESFTSTAGRGSSFTGSSNAGGKFANISVTLKEDRDITSADASIILRDLFSEIPTATFRITEEQTGPSSGAPVFIKFFGEDLESLALTAERADKLLASIDGTRDITTSTKNNATEIVLTIDKAKASALNVSPRAVGEVLRGAVYGITATTITENGDDVDIIAKIALDSEAGDPAETPKITLTDLKGLRIETQDGSSVLLGSIVEEKLGAAQASIVHEDETRVETVSAYTQNGVTATEVVSAFKARESELEIPEGVRISYGGETEDINKSFTEMFVALIAGLVFMLAILVLSFNSIRYALYLLLAVPYSLIGVFVGLTLTGQPLSFTSLLGVIALAGVIINHAIILMDSLLHMHKARTDAPLIDVVADASVTRLRPIVLTTVTTVIGMVPLSRISDFWSPLAFTIMFGLTFAMILTLVLVPTLFYRHELKIEAKKST
ncbi:efflux RND transporter permease subunit [Patescibacteria group bacterium]|nr:efflux RND transporter permease subunit [Patescibacteria group bacterium]